MVQYNYNANHDVLQSVHQQFLSIDYLLKVLKILYKKKAKLSIVYLLILFYEDQHKMKVENVFSDVEQLVRVYEHMKHNHNLVDIVLQMLLFLIEINAMKTFIIIDEILFFLPNFSTNPSRAES